MLFSEGVADWRPLSRTWNIRWSTSAIVDLSVIVAVVAHDLVFVKVEEGSNTVESRRDDDDAPRSARAPPKCGPKCGLR